MRNANFGCNSVSQRKQSIYVHCRKVTQFLACVLLLTAFFSAGPQLVRAHDHETRGTQTSNAQEVLLHSRAHAHNDYEHTRPLLDALDHGFMSIEADVFLVNGDLLVAHNLKDVLPDRTLDRLYLRPLYERFLEHRGSIYKQAGPVTLLIDIKRDGVAVYEELERQLIPYKDMLTRCEDGRVTQGAVTIVIGGDRPADRIAESNPRFVGIDGRLSDLTVPLDEQKSSALMPLISDNWRLHFSYRGDGQMSEAERAKLREIVTKAHKQGRKIRFWATPESEQLWMELCDAGVDLIGTDDLSRLRSFLESRKTEEKS